MDRLGIYSNLHIVHCGPQGLTYLRDGEPSMSATTAPPDAQLSVKHQVPANLADGLALGLVKILRFFANTFFQRRYGHRAVILESSMRRGHFIALFGTNQGWSVSAGGERLGLFVTQRQALDDVKKRRARLTASGQRSTVLVTGHELASPSGRSTRPIRFSR